VCVGQIQPNEGVQVDIKGAAYMKSLKLDSNKPDALDICGKDVTITANGVGNVSATFIVSTFRGRLQDSGHLTWFP